MFEFEKIPKSLNFSEETGNLSAKFQPEGLG